VITHTRTPAVTDGAKRKSSTANTKIITKLLKKLKNVRRKEIQFHSVLALSMSAFLLRVHILKACEHDVLKTAGDDFIKFTTSVQLGTGCIQLQYEVVRF